MNPNLTLNQSYIYLTSFVIETIIMFVLVKKISLGVSLLLLLILFIMYKINHDTYATI